LLGSFLYGHRRIRRDGFASSAALEFSKDLHNILSRIRACAPVGLVLLVVQRKT